MKEKIKKVKKYKSNYVYRNRDKFNGEWKDNKIYKGQIIKNYNNGDKYDGKYKNNLKLKRAVQQQDEISSYRTAENYMLSSVVAFDISKHQYI